MEKITLKVEDYTPVRRKDKTVVAGMGKGGVPWQLFKVNKKYSYFFHGEGKPDFVLGKEYPFDMETKQEGLYTNYQIFRPKQEAKPLEDIPVIEEPTEPGKADKVLNGLKILRDNVDGLIKFMEK